MWIETARIPSQLLVDYSAIPIAFKVSSVVSAEKGADRPFVLTEHRVEPPYLKDYDAVGACPRDWAAQFDTSQWLMFLARAESQILGGATVAVGTSGLDLLEGRNDLAVLWDIRVVPDCRGRGVGRALFEAVEAWALALGCHELKTETQNINAPACRFYAALGCELRGVREDAYPQCPGEAQFLWYKAFGSGD